jgi:hypothetical protein
MAIDKFRPFRARRRITMDTSTFDLRAVSFGWAVIDAH